MLLNSIETGAGERVVLLLHGLMGSAESWSSVAAALAARGHQVLAVDLPGHGDSPRESHATVESAADAVVDTVRARLGDRRIMAIGHSYGGTVLAAAADRLPLDLAVYVDTVCAFAGGADRDALMAEYEHDRNVRRDPGTLRAARPYYSDEAVRFEASAAERFDPGTAASLLSGADVSYPPAPGSIVVRAEPSRFVGDEDAAALRDRGVEVRSIPGAEHTIWYSHFDEFVAVLPEVFGAPSALD